MQKYLLNITLLSAFTIISFYSMALPSVTPATVKMVGRQQAAKLLFTENLGQVVDEMGDRSPDVLFTAHTGAMQLFLTSTAINYQFTKIVHPTDNKSYGEKYIKKIATIKKDKIDTYRFSVSLTGSNPHPFVRKELKNVYTENFYTTGCQNGILNVGTYEKVVYENVYPNIDWVVYSNDNKLKYDFLVHPGGNPKQIKLKVDNAQNVQLTNAGELIIKTTFGEVREKPPISYLGDAPVKSSFKENTDGTIGFDVTSSTNEELRIDPSVEWTVNFGLAVSPTENGNCDVDKGGNVFITGTALASLIFASGYQDTSAGDYDAYLLKMDSSGTILWGTYYGGNNTDLGGTCSADPYGNVYISGQAASTGLATLAAFQDTFMGSYDAFLAKFNANGHRIWSTYCGYNGLGYNTNPCKADKAGNVYLAASSWEYAPISINYPYEAGFLIKFDSSGNKIWGTYCGGNGGAVFMNAIDIDPNDNIFLGGGTNSYADLSTNGTTLSTSSGTFPLDGFVLKFDSSGNQLWGTYYGGESYDEIWGVSADSYGNVYCTGFTESLAGITSFGAWQPNADSSGIIESFLAKIDASGNRRWGTYYGGHSSAGVGSQGYFVKTDNIGNVFFCGMTDSYTGIASAGAYQGSLTSQNNGFLAIFDTAGQQKWGSYFPNGLTGCAANNWGNIYVSGYDDLIKLFNPPVLFTDTSITGPYCAGDTIYVSFNLTDSFNSSNIFTAELSDSARSFISPINIGNIAGNQVTAITCIIPLNTSTGNNYRIRVSGTHPLATGGDNGHDIRIVALPKQPDSFIVSSTSVCEGEQQVAYFVPADSTVVHAWLYSGSDTHISGAGDSVYLSFSNNATSGLLQVSASNACGISTPRTISITVNPNPIVSASGAPVVCKGNTDTLTGAGADTYVWYPAKTLSAGSGTSVIAYPTGATTYNVAGFTNGCSDTAALTVDVAPPPNDSIVIDWPFILCSGSTLKLQTGSYPNYRYQWQLNDSDIAGAYSSSYSASSNGNYNVRITDTVGCIGVTSQVYIDTIAAPDPVISYAGDRLCVSGYATYQWYLNGIELAGATNPCIKPLKNGDYTVAVTNIAGCSTMSSKFSVVLKNPPIIVSFYPNPASNILYINASINVEVQIYTIDGKIVMNVENASAIDLNKLPNAVYMIKVYDIYGRYIKSEKLVKNEL